MKRIFGDVPGFAPAPDIAAAARFIESFCRYTLVAIAVEYFMGLK